MSIFTNTSRAIAKAATIALPKLGEYTVRGLATTIIIAEKGVSVAGNFAQNVKDEMDAKKATLAEEQQIEEETRRMNEELAEKIEREYHKVDQC
jgi:hypothetical protein|tara:strand:- start:145 stop:426 length:282 start_codon:yes stop_codon:yes gene_type:complete